MTFFVLKALKWEYEKNNVTLCWSLPTKTKKVSRFIWMALLVNFVYSSKADVLTFFWRRPFVNFINLILFHLWRPFCVIQQQSIFIVCHPCWSFVGGPLSIYLCFFVETVFPLSQMQFQPLYLIGFRWPRCQFLGTVWWLSWHCNFFLYVWP